MKIEMVGGFRDQIGEGPVWDPLENALYWVDSEGCTVQRLDPRSGEHQSWDVPSRIGSLALAEPGSLLVALRDGFYGLDLATGSIKPIQQPEAADEGVRFNDGRMDRQGRFLCGTLRLEVRDPPAGKLYRLSDDGSVEVLEQGVSVSNAICLSPEGDTLYYADTLQDVIWAYEYDVRGGGLGPRRVLADIRSLTGSGADGAVTDTRGGLWVALPQSGRICRLTPDGELDLMFETPTPHPACPAFGGPELEVLYVTSISHGGPAVQANHPLAGRLIAVHGLGARGIPEPRFRLAPAMGAAG